LANYDLHLRGKAWNELTVEEKAELLNTTGDLQLESYIVDQRCNQRFACETALAKRRAEKAADLEANPFNPRTEVSADARHVADRIVKHLWIIFVVLPFVLAILYEILKGV
jgi:hypothetical protein